MDIYQMLDDMEKLMLSSNNPNILVLRQAMDFVDGFLGTFIGIIVWVLIVSVPLTTLIDISFFIVPTFQGYIMKIGKTTKGRFSIITKSAFRCYEKFADEGEDSIVKYYLWARMKDYFTMAIMFGLVVGPLWDGLLDWMLDIIKVVIMLISNVL